MTIRGAETLGVLPNNWRIRKVGDLCRVGTGGTPNTKLPEYYEPATINWIKSGDVKGFYIRSAEHKISDAGMKNSAAMLHPQGTVLMAMSGRGKTRGTTAILRIEAACSQSVAAIVPGEDVSSEFVHFQFIKRYPEIRAITGNDDRSGLNMSLIRDIDLIVPPLMEQRKIAVVLGWLQRAIEQQERLIALTQELKKSLMHKLFTEGLRGERQKQTEIGLVPESWDVVKLADCCMFMSGGTPSKQKDEFWIGSIPWVSPKDMKKPRLSDVVDHISEAALEDGSDLAPAGSVFVVLRGMILAKDVPIALAEVPMAFNQDMKAVIPGPQLVPSFLLYAMVTFKRNLFQKVGRSAHGTMTLLSSEIERFIIPLPDKRTQEEIADAIATVEQKHEQHRRKRDSLSDLFRTLLHQLMTAQIRVHDLDLSFLEQEAVAS